MTTHFPEIFRYGNDPLKNTLFLRNPERSPPKNRKNLPTQLLSVFYIKFPQTMLIFLTKR